jgi:outer membrane lipoprotein-sorting protein
MRYVVSMRFLLSLLMAAGLFAPAVSSAIDKAPLEKWLQSQREYHSVYAEFVQTRKLATLRKPLVHKGKMWAKRPDLFLWRMGDPAVVTVLRKKDNYLYLDKEKNEAILMGADSRYARQFEMLTGDMGENLGEFEKRFIIKATKVVNGVYHATFTPANRRFRKRVPWLILSVDIRTNRTAGFEIHLEDKSVISTQFTRYSLNVAIPDSRFKVDTTGYKIKRK